MSGPSDQDLAGLRDGLPRLWWSLYQGSLTAGFNERQAFILLQTWLAATSAKGVILPDGEGPKSDAE